LLTQAHMRLSKRELQKVGILIIHMEILKYLRLKMKARAYITK